MLFGTLETRFATRRKTPTRTDAETSAGSIAPLAGLIVVCALGVLIIAIAFGGARRSRSWADATLWVGMLVIVLPVTLRLVGGSAQRGERLALVIVLGVALYAVRVLLSPTQFVMHDELGAYRTIADILRTGTLYTPSNPVVAAYSAYPGIASATAALSTLSGLGIVPCGLIIIGVAKVLTMGGLFLFVERCARSPRVAGTALVLYTANPNFVYFDSQFAYESLALGLGALALWTMVRAADDTDGGWTDVGLAALLDGALVLTHHLTSYAVAILFCAWAIAQALRDLRSPATRRLAVLAAFSLAITVAYLIGHLHATESDIGGSIVGSLHGLYQIISGNSRSKAPFTSAAGYSNPPLEQVFGLLSVVLLLAAWPFGLFVSWRERRIGPGVVILGLVSLLYPASLALRLTAAGSETSNRTSEFVFAGLAAALALAFVAMLGGRRARRGWRSRGLTVVIATFVGVVFAGGITIGTPPYDMLPGSYLVGADNRSIDTEGVAAAQWAARWLRPGGNFLADQADNQLMSAYTRLRPQSGTVDGKGVGELFVSPTYGPAERRIITFDKLRYLVIDRRDDTALPHSGHYFGGGDPEMYSAPIAAQALDKFNHISCIGRIFSSGNVHIYATGRVAAGCR